MGRSRNPECGRVVLIAPLVAVILCPLVMVSCTGDNDMLSNVALAGEKAPTAASFAQTPDVVAPDTGTMESENSPGEKKPEATLTVIVGTERDLTPKNVIWGEDDENVPAKQDGPARRASKVKFGAGELGQFCNKANVQGKVRSRAAAIRACYSIQLQDKPDIKGKVTAQWKIGLTGMVSGAKVVENETADEELEECLVKIINMLHFQKPTGGICTVQWPFTFTAGE